MELERIGNIFNRSRKIARSFSSFCNIPIFERFLCMVCFPAKTWIRTEQMFLFRLMTINRCTFYVPTAAFRADIGAKRKSKILNINTTFHRIKYDFTKTRHVTPVQSTWNHSNEQNKNTQKPFNKIWCSIFKHIFCRNIPAVRCIMFIFWLNVEHFKF